jgi:hypothetical protein
MERCLQKGVTHMAQTPIPKEQSASGSVDQNVKPKHPGFGFMKGLLTVRPERT